MYTSIWQKKWNTENWKRDMRIFWRISVKIRYLVLNLNNVTSMEKAAND